MEGQAWEQFSSAGGIPLTSFGITGREPGMSEEPGSNTAEGFSDEHFCKMLFWHNGQKFLDYNVDAPFFRKKGVGASPSASVLSPKMDKILTFYSNNQNYKRLFPLKILSISLITCNEEDVAE